MNEEEYEDSNDPQQDFLPADPVLMERMRKIAVDKVKETITRKCGFEEDEIDTLFPTEEALFKFVHEVYLLRDVTSDESYLGMDENTPGDDEDELTPQQRRDAERIRRYKKEYKQKIAALRKAAQDYSQKIAAQIEEKAQEVQAEAFEEAGKHLPAEDRVSFSEWLKLAQELELEDLPDENT